MALRCGMCLPSGGLRRTVRTSVGPFSCAKRTCDTLSSRPRAPWRPSSRCNGPPLLLVQATADAPSTDTPKQHSPGAAKEPGPTGNGNGDVQLKAKRAYLIYNPVAGQEDPEALLGQIALKLSSEFQLTMAQTKPHVSAELLAQQALSEGVDLVVASGGDGTVGAVAGVLIGTGVPLGVVPRGTANAFSVALGIPTPLDDAGTVASTFATHACEVILAGHATDVDTALVTTTEVTDYPMILLLGIGLEAEVVEGADRDMKNALGPLAYILSGARQVLSAQNFKTKARLDGEEVEGEAAAVTVANAAPPFSVLAHGQVGECLYNDGALEAIGYRATDSKVGSMVTMAKLFAGALFNDNDNPVGGDDVPWDIFGGRYKDIRIECDPPQKVVLDGELLGMTPVHVRVRPASLKVLVPPPEEVQQERAAAAEKEVTLMEQVLDSGALDT